MNRALRPFAAALCLAAGACSHAHVASPRHHWMPASRAVFDHINHGEVSNDWQSMAVGATLLVLPVVVDAVSLPFHGLGHLFARRERVPVEAAP